MIYDRWVFAETADAAIPIANPTLRSVFVRRGVDTDEKFTRFVSPTLDDLHDPAGIHGIDTACERIFRAIRDRETIVIYGDYDVDGVTSIVLLQTVLRLIGADPAFVVPHRLVDGYGLKIEVLERALAARNVKLVITVDCGITSIEPVRLAIERGIDVIITDHHLPPGVLPHAAAVLNPKQEGCAYPFKELAGVGVAFKLCCELIRRSGKKISIESLLKIAAIGTVADVAPLVGENRVIARLGLDGLAETRNRGLRALLRRVGLQGRPLRATDVGFKIGPRINAAGRLASADTAIQLFAATDDDQAWAICGELDRLNAERQEIEVQVRDAASQQIAGDERVLVLAGEMWHKGVVGLTAGRIAQQVHRPTLVISLDGDRAIGSARSIPTINLHGQLLKVSDLFTHFGGHEFACGFSLPAADVPKLRARLTAQFADLDDALFVRDAYVEGCVTLAEVDRDFVFAHEMLQPFGAGNVQPLFAIRGTHVTAKRPFAEDCCELTLQDVTGSGAAVVWPSAKRLNTAINGAAIDLLVQIEADGWSDIGGRMSVVDVRPAE
ncbi:MAG TPA: single-stranded-DNA-specific exonuclease RecJ [Thermoanaerobaculia bacterium]|nr:single-stranded-DNA-specific exonuclease RecJ [Thermoanaerobaculia bacterium]